MSTTNQPLPAEPQDQAKNDGVAAELSNEAIQNLTGFFDVLIQMDLAQKIRNEIRSKEDEEKVSISDEARSINHPKQSTS